MAEPINQQFKDKFPEIDPVILQLLHNRGLNTQDKIDEFFGPDYSRDMYNPFDFKMMAAAVNRISQAILNQEKIMVYGDYDADGVCSTVILADTIKLLGIEPEIYIPYRELEGYGLNQKVVKEIIRKKINLVITVDCGIANFDEVKELMAAGVDVIVTDHHEQIEALPPALAVINPKVKGEQYKYRELSGCAVAFKLIQAMLEEKNRKQYPKISWPPIGYEKWLLDLVAISLVTDMCDLLDENRVLAKFGLLVIKKTKRAGLKALIEVAGTKPEDVKSDTIGFQIGPRLNAAGRMDHASLSYQLLITEKSDEAKELAEKLNQQNRRRQNIMDEVYKEAKEQVKKDLDQKILIAYNEKWKPSLVGLAAGKLSDEYHRPVLAISKNLEGRIIGSGRSIEGFDITQTLKKCEEFLERFGGHAGACGFTLKNHKILPEFKKKITAIANKEISDEDIRPLIKIESCVDLKQINWTFFENLEKFEPFGEGNATPIFLIEKVKVSSTDTVGQKNNHLKMQVTDGHNKVTRKMIGFCFGDWCQRLKVGDLLDVVVEVGVNEWNGNRELQLKIVDLKFCKD